MAQAPSAAAHLLRPAAHGRPGGREPVGADVPHDVAEERPQAGVEIRGVEGRRDGEGEGRHAALTPDGAERFPDGAEATRPSHVVAGSGGGVGVPAEAGIGVGGAMSARRASR